MAEAVEEKVKTFVFQKKLRIAEFSRDYDKRRSGYITTPQFHRTLDMCNVALSTEEVKLLEEKYGDGAGRVNYKAFQTAIDGAFTPAGMEQHPTTSFGGSFVPTTSLPALGAGEEAQAQGILDRIAEYIDTRKVLARPAFVEHEQDQNSVMIIHHVTGTQFASVLTWLNITPLLSLTPAEVKLIAKKYDDRGDGTVNWHLFLERVDSFGVDPITGPPKPFPTKREMPDVYDMRDPTQPSAQVAELIGKIATECRTNAIRVHSFFEDFDKLRANSIPYKKFCSGLSMALEKVTWKLSPEDMLALGEYFKADTPENFLVGKKDGRPSLAGTTYFHQFFIRWMDFCNEIDSANTIKGLENAPLGATMRSFGASRPGVRENALAEQAIEKIKTEVRKQGVLVKHFFQDFCANQNSVMIINHVTRQQFEQCIARLKFKVSREEILAVADMFGGRGDGTVNYRAFVEAVDPAPPSINPWKTNDQIVAAEAAGAPAPVAAAPAPVAPDGAAAVEKVKAACLKYKIRIHEFFQDFDRLRSGVVTSRQMEIALNMAFNGVDVGIGEAEVKALAEAYQSEKIAPVELKSKGKNETYYSVYYVRWHDLADDVDSVFTVKGLAAMSPSMETTTGLPAFAMTNADISADDEELCAEASARMKTTLDTERILLRWVFDDFAANKNSPLRVQCVTHQQFKQVLAMLKLPVQPHEVAALVRKYDLKGDGFVNYHSFCTDLQPPPPHINPWKTVGA